MWQIIFVIALIVLCIIACIYFAGKAEIKYQEKELADLKQEMQDLVNPEKMYDRLGVDVVSVPVGQGLLCIADPDQEGSLLAKIAALRQKMTDNYGYIIPSVRVFDSSELKENEYCISIRNNVVDTGFVYPGKYMVIADQYEAKFDKIPEDAVDAEDPAYKTKVYWLNRSDAKEATSKDVTAVDAEDVIITHLSETLINQVEYVLTDNDIKKLFKLLEDDKFEESLLKKISYSDIKNVLVNLIKEKVSVRDITFIFSKLEDYSRFSKEPDILSERIRKDLSRQLSLTNCNRDKIIHAIEILPELTKKLVEKVQPQKGYTKTKLEIDFEEYKDLVETIAEKLMKNHQKIGSQPVIFCDEKLRLGLYRLLVKHIPTIVVLAPNEIVNDVKVEIVDTVV